MPVDSSKFGSQSKMSGGSSSTGSCTSVSDLKMGEEDKSTSTTHSTSSSSGPLIGGGGGQTVIPDDYFDAAIEESMEMLEKSALESSSDNDEYGGDVDMEVVVGSKEEQQQQPLRSSSPLSSSGATTPSTEEETFDISLSESDIDLKLALFNQNVQIRMPDVRAAHANHHVSFPMPPPLPPIRVDRYSVVGRRRLSQCKEEENEEEESGAVNSALLSMRKSSSLNEDSTTTDRRLFSDEEEEEEEKEINQETAEVPVVEAKVDEVKAAAALPFTSRFTVVKTEHKEPEVVEKEKPKVKTNLRSGVEAMLRNSSAKQNSQTIHFPCSAPVQNNRMSVQTMFEPHLDKRFFDSSLVEIRSLNDSLQEVNEDVSLNDSVDSNSNDIWVKRSEKASASDDGVSAVG